MKTAFLENPQNVVLKDIPIPEPKAGELRIKLKKIGICGSDVSLFLGKRLLNKPTIIGHEGLGIVEKIGEKISTRKLGERVAVEPNIPCGECKFCKQERGNICINKRVIGVNENGCFAEYICLPEEFCWPIPDEISDENAVMLEPTAVVVHALSKSSAKPGETIAVIGLGAIGLLLTDLAIALGYQVFVTEINQEKLALAQKLGAKEAKGTENKINKIWEENEVITVFECAGLAQTATLATNAAPRGSEIILLGLATNAAQFTPLKIVREGISILPSIIYNHPADFRKAIDLIRKKIIIPGKFISSYFPLSQIQIALEKASKGDQTKIIIEI
ncbi:L-iditol 2-dehydrogenase [Lacihabitans sp. LS3-19]|uniref:zinc-dependent alcohol dehydrogenase n=1 Tax=Lacihabitans sp. LS3-19 TaxID=2487335 RepID=UPI0020CCF490|nr:alcohol dehydrogenase catalytic domain-containing protein [Lacihabitans sp. LS3-19]MCP9770413.1 L-iditol 2-dehydrogenase [Lacihabitans sp. LS3-19]